MNIYKPKRGKCLKLKNERTLSIARNPCYDENCIDLFVCFYFCRLFLNNIIATLKVLNFVGKKFRDFAILGKNCEMKYPRKMSETKNRDIKYPRNFLPEIIFAKFWIRKYFLAFPMHYLQD